MIDTILTVMGCGVGMLLIRYYLHRIGYYYHSKYNAENRQKGQYNENK